MNRTDALTATLRTLDAADRPVDPSGPRARADLDAILASAPRGPGPRPRATPVGARRPPRTFRHLALAGGAVAAVTAGVVVLPALTGGDQAFATWRTAPEGMSAQQSADAASACRASMAAAAGQGDEADLAGATAAVAERRGVWTTVVLAGRDGFSALCISDDSAGPFTDAMIGSLGTPAGYTAPGPRELLATDLGTGTMDAGDISLAAGHVGDDVVGVVHRSEEHGAVTATVGDGRFALWFPGDELVGAARAGVDVEVAYRDGTTGTVRLTL